MLRQVLGLIRPVVAAIALTALSAIAQGDSTASPSTIEYVFWLSIQSDNNAAAYAAYLKRYPRGAFTEIAAHRLSKLDPNAPQTVVVEGAPFTSDYDDPDISFKFEKAYWDCIRDSNDPEEFRAYLRRYPNGTFAEIAKSRLAQ